MKIKGYQKDDISILLLLSLGAALAVSSNHHGPLEPANLPTESIRAINAAERQVVRGGEVTEIAVAPTVSG